MAIIGTSPVCFYYPTKVVFLDDNQAFLDTLDLEFHSQINMQTLTNPKTTLEVINSNREDIARSIFKMLQDVNIDTSADCVIGLNVSNILNILYDKTRFDHVSILIVDYNMPHINGIEICQKLKKQSLFKILLTAEADQNIAIQAFNNSLIDKFILKTNNELYLDLILAIKELTQRHFTALSNNIINGYMSSVEDLFNTQSYIQLFSEVLLKLQPVEYYLVDTSGSFIFLDKNANPTWLIVRHHQELEEQLKLLQGYDIPENIMKSFARKEKMLFLFSESDYKKPIAEWTQYMFDAEKLDNNYCYSIIRGQLTDSIHWDKVVSYATYLEEINSIK